MIIANLIVTNILILSKNKNSGCCFEEEIIWKNTLNIRWFGYKNTFTLIHTYIHTHTQSEVERDWKKIMLSRRWDEPKTLTIKRYETHVKVKEKTQYYYFALRKVKCKLRKLFVMLFFIAYTFFLLFRAKKVHFVRVFISWLLYSVMILFCA